MISPRERFTALLHQPESDPAVGEMRENLTQLKLEALEQVKGVDEEGLRVVMPDLYEQLVVTQVQLAAHVGLGVCMALCAHDELARGGSLSLFSREVREQMTEMGVALKKRHSSRIGGYVAEIEAQRLALRHGHEFLSWLAFRRGDEKYPASDRLERITAFKVDQRLLQSRGVLIRTVGPRLAAAVEGADRFMLGNRWRLENSDEHAVERHVWPLLSYQSGAAVRVEQARWEHDVLVDAEASAEALDASRAQILALLGEQLEESLVDLPAPARAGGF